MTQNLVGLKKKVFALVICLGTTVTLTAVAKMKTAAVEYRVGNTTLEGFVAYDDQMKTKRPGVLIIHEWKGLGDYEKRRATEIAKLGYIAFAADIYGKGVRPNDNAEAGKLAGIYKGDRKLFRERAVAGLAELLKQPGVDAKKIAAIGYCFGGTGVLELARSGAEVKGVVSFHGGLDSPTPADAKNIKGKVLVLHGADDPNVPPKVVAEFEEEMKASKVNWELVKYANTVHAFTNPAAGNDPSKGAAYNAESDHRSWEAMKSFFAEIF